MIMNGESTKICKETDVWRGWEIPESGNPVVLTIFEPAASQMEV